MFDIAVSLIFCIALLPLFVLICIILLFANRGKPFFTQVRPGKNGRLFRLIKFRTMNDRRDAEGGLLPDFERLTTAGKIMRKTSLDEIPQLLNVLKGNMSLVGPRPLLVEYLPLYNTFQARRHEVLPGITGWAQVNGRNAISWEQKFVYDVWYVDHISLRTDLKILWITALKVFRRDDVNASAILSMEKFSGNKNE